MKRPIVIEFSGLPNSGKTTLLNNVKKICKLNNVNATFLSEPAESLPTIIPKGDITQTLWITLETLQKSLETIYIKDVDFILLDRGFYNQLFWATMYEEKDEQYSKFITEFMERFAKMYRVKPDYLYVVDVDVDESIRRRMKINSEITFSKKDFLDMYRKKFEKFILKIDQTLYIDTTNLNENEVANNVFNQIISLR